MQIKLRVLTGSHEGKEIPVTSEKFLIGRSEPCQLRPKSESVSRKHCILVVKDNRLLVQDLKSRNGTFVNEKRLPTDKAKVLKDGDELRVGKLRFGIVVEHGLQAPKKTEVSDIGDAAARTMESGSQDSRFEAVDVSAWLDEADQIERVRRLSDPETRQFRLDNAAMENTLDGSADSTEISGASDDSKDIKIPEKKKPGKIPEHLKKAAMKENSTSAADDALKRFFSGR